MATREAIREYFESRLCSDLLQEYCSGCNFTRQDGDYCETVKEQVAGTLGELSELGVALKVERELPLNPFGAQKGVVYNLGQQGMLTAGCCFVVPLI